MPIAIIESDEFFPGWLWKKAPEQAARPSLATSLKL